MKRAALSIVIVFAVTLFLSGCVDQRVTEHEQLIAMMNDKIGEMENKPVIDARQIVEQVVDATQEIVAKTVHNEVEMVMNDLVVDAVLDRLCKYEVEVVMHDYKDMKGNEAFEGFIEQLKTELSPPPNESVGVKPVLVKEKPNKDGSLSLIVSLPHSSYNNGALSNLINAQAEARSVDVAWVPGKVDETCAFETQSTKLAYVPTQLEITGVDNIEVEIRLVVDKLLEGSHVMLQPTRKFGDIFSKFEEITIDGRQSDYSDLAYIPTDLIKANRTEITIAGSVSAETLRDLNAGGAGVHAMVVRVREVEVEGEREPLSVVTYSYFDVRSARAVLFGDKVAVKNSTKQPACYPKSKEHPTVGETFNSQILYVAKKPCVTS